MQAQQALALLYAKVAGRPFTLIIRSVTVRNNPDCLGVTAMDRRGIVS